MTVFKRNIVLNFHIFYLPWSANLLSKQFLESDFFNGIFIMAIKKFRPLDVWNYVSIIVRLLSNEQFVS